MKHWLLAHKLIVAILLAGVIVLAVLVVAVQKSSAPSGNKTPVGVETVIEGQAVCLPHKDTDGPQTMECAFGVRLDDGTYFGLRDGKDSNENVSSLPMNQKVQLTGILKEEPSDTYQSIGTFTVTETQVVE